ncbi:TPA: integrase, partial [Elizabethkingia anophelis]
CLSFIQQKTGKEIVLPLHPEVEYILGRNNNAFPEYLSINDYNVSIKAIAKHAGLVALLPARKRIGHRVKTVLIEKWQTISSHIGRRSFATNFYGKIPTPLLMQVTGHSTEHIFLKYINPTDQSHIISLSNYFEQIHQKRQVTVL